MERLPSLINSLKFKYENGASSGEILALLDDMRNELVKSHPSVDHSYAPVSVWLPAGYSINGSNNAVSVYEVKPDAANTKTISNNAINDQNGLKFSMLKPPVNTVIEDDEIEDVVIKEVDKGIEVEPVIEPILLEAREDKLFQFEQKKKNDENLTIYTETPAENAPFFIELDITEEEVEQSIEFIPEIKPYLPDSFLSSNNNNSTQTAAKPKELHEILASRVVAHPETGFGKSKILADSLGSGKIVDLRKGIAINDRFRFIKSLFRGDESLFERSVKTINNFNIFQEAEYWMQRELLIKLGWNEEDELVQQFYVLVRRRFL
jgi:hypothetical protein